MQEDTFTLSQALHPSLAGFALNEKGPRSNPRALLGLRSDDS